MKLSRHKPANMRAHKLKSPSQIPANQRKLSHGFLSSHQSRAEGRRSDGSRRPIVNDWPRPKERRACYCLLHSPSSTSASPIGQISSGVFGVLGLLLLIITLIVPQMLGPIEATLRLVGAKIGEWVLLAALAVVYLMVTTPIGFLIRTLRGTAPIYQWSTSVPHDGEGWTIKSVSTVVRGGVGMAGSRTGVVGVISFLLNEARFCCCQRSSLSLRHQSASRKAAQRG
jgi:hypothetical protein